MDEVSGELEQRERELRGVMETNRIRLQQLMGDLESGRRKASYDQDIKAANEEVAQPGNPGIWA